jgi:hypothetical protein
MCPWLEQSYCACFLSDLIDRLSQTISPVAFASAGSISSVCAPTACHRNWYLVWVVSSAPSSRCDHNMYMVHLEDHVMMLLCVLLRSSATHMGARSITLDATFLHEPHICNMQYRDSSSKAAAADRGGLASSSFSVPTKPFSTPDGRIIHVLKDDYGFRSGGSRLYEEHYGEVPSSIFSLVRLLYSQLMVLEQWMGSGPTKSQLIARH